MQDEIKMEDIIKAVQTIKMVCEQYYSSCENCPLRNEYNDCLIASDNDALPKYWEIYNPKNIRVVINTGS